MGRSLLVNVLRWGGVPRFVLVVGAGATMLVAVPWSEAAAQGEDRCLISARTEPRAWGIAIEGSFDCSGVEEVRLRATVDGVLLPFGQLGPIAAPSGAFTFPWHATTADRSVPHVVGVQAGDREWLHVAGRWSVRYVFPAPTPTATAPAAARGGLTPPPTPSPSPTATGTPTSPPASTTTSTPETVAPTPTSSATTRTAPVSTSTSSVAPTNTPEPPASVTPTATPWLSTSTSTPAGTTSAIAGLPMSRARVAPVLVTVLNPACVGQPAREFVFGVPGEGGLFREMGHLDTAQVFLREGLAVRALASRFQHAVVLDFLSADGGAGSRLIVDGAVVKEFRRVSVREARGEAEALARALGPIGGGLANEPAGRVYFGLTYNGQPIGGYEVSPLPPEEFARELLRRGVRYASAMEVAAALGVSPREIARYLTPDFSTAGIGDGPPIDLAEAVSAARLSAEPAPPTERVLSDTEAAALGLRPCAAPSVSTPAPAILATPGPTPAGPSRAPPARSPTRRAPNVQAEGPFEVLLPTWEVTDQTHESIELRLTLRNNGRLTPYVIDLRPMGRVVSASGLPPFQVLPACRPALLQLDVRCREIEVGPVWIGRGEEILLRADGVGSTERTRAILQAVWGLDLLHRVTLGDPLPDDAEGLLEDAMTLLQTLSRAGLQIEEVRELGGVGRMGAVVYHAYQIGDAALARDPVGLVAALNSAVDDPVVRAWLAENFDANFDGWSFLRWASRVYRVVEFEVYLLATIWDAPFEELRITAL